MTSVYGPYSREGAEMDGSILEVIDAPILLVFYRCDPRMDGLRIYGQTGWQTICYLNRATHKP
jgi:hypothetical protein